MPTVASWPVSFAGLVSSGQLALRSCRRGRKSGPGIGLPTTDNTVSSTLTPSLIVACDSSSTTATSACYVGFTGGTGGAAALQTISNFTFSSYDGSPQNIG